MCNAYNLAGALANLIRVVGVLKRNPSLVLIESEDSIATLEAGQAAGNLLAYPLFLLPQFSPSSPYIDN